MDKKYTMAELLAEFGDRFDILEEIKKENKKLEEKEIAQPEVTDDVAKEEKKEKDNTPKDITLKCIKCEKEWVWSVAEQKFYKEKGFYKPSMCKDCRKKIKTVNNFHKV